MTTTNGAIAERGEVVESARCLSEAAGRLGAALEAESDSVSGAKFGVICMVIDDPHFRPKNAQSLPPLVAQRLPHHLARQLAVGLNQEAIDCRKGVWHFVVRARAKWHGVLRVQFAPRCLPRHPDSYAVDGLDIGQTCERPNQALQIAEDENRVILRIARVPREWCVPVCRLEK